MPSQRVSRRCIEMSTHKRVKREHGPLCLFCKVQKPPERADSPYCSRDCMRKSLDRKRKQYCRRRRRREARKRERHRCRICGKPVEHPRKYCPGHLCTVCKRREVKVKRLCWRCYIRQYRALSKQRKACSQPSPDAVDNGRPMTSLPPELEPEPTVTEGVGGEGDGEGKEGESEGNEGGLPGEGDDCRERRGEPDRDRQERHEC